MRLSDNFVIKHVFQLCFYDFQVLWRWDKLKSLMGHTAWHPWTARDLDMLIGVLNSSYIPGSSYHFCFTGTWKGIKTKTLRAMQRKKEFFKETHWISLAAS
jgi:hypothetical protein